MTTSLSSKIYEVLDKDFDESSVKELSDRLASTISKRLKEGKELRKGTLRLSAIGKHPRLQYMDYHYPSRPTPAKRLMFLNGDIWEDTLVWLLKEAGVKVEDEQAEVKVDGVVGHIDFIADGQLTDAKSASPNSFKKFSEGTLLRDDKFGYCGQMAGYNTKYKSDKPGWLAVNKATGELADFRVDPDFDLPDPHDLVAKSKEAIKECTSEYCEEPVKLQNGNTTIGFGCKFCQHKYKCFPKLRAFKYAKEIVYLKDVKKLPRVEEITKKDKEEHEERYR